MKELYTKTIIVSFLAGWLVACDPCRDCEAVSFEPTVSMIFINQDSLIKLNDRLAFFAFNDSALTVHVNALDTLRDRLAEIQIGLNSGNTDLQSEKDFILSLIPQQKEDSGYYATLNKDADSLTLVYNQAKTQISSGSVKLDKLEIVGGAIYTYQDSATLWTLPLSYTVSFDQYLITIRAVTDTLELDYEVFREMDSKRNVLIRAKNIELVSFTKNLIDSVKTNCGDHCTDENTTFTIYF